MIGSNKRPNSDPWFWIGLAVVFLLSVFLRFWGLGRFNTFVFDEVYYAKFANNYLTHTKFFNAHPPLSQYIIAIGIWIGSHLPIGQDTVNNLTGSVRSTWSYRWINAFTGSFIPLVVAAIAYQISSRRSYALIAALFAASDGLFLVESRYALNNVYLVIFGLLGQLFLLLGLKRHGIKRSLYLALAGVWFGASAAIKWNGLWFLLGADLIWLAAWVIRLTPLKNTYTSRRNTTPLQNLTQLNIGHLLIYLAVIPIAVYSLAWIPHLQQNPTPNFWEMQKQILAYHERIGDGAKIHPYCSDWYTWLLMLRPVAYFYRTAASTTEPLVFDTPAPPTTVANVIYDVHAMGNPVLWWLSTAAIFYMLWLVLRHSWSTQKFSLFPQISDRQITDHWIILYLVLNWLANLLPWVPVTRCTFIYHYMGASVFSGLAIAHLVDRWLESYRPSRQVLGLTIVLIILLAFVFWMPVYLGLPLSVEEYRLRLPYFDYSQLPPRLKQFLPHWI